MSGLVSGRLALKKFLNIYKKWPGGRPSQKWPGGRPSQKWPGSRPSQKWPGSQGWWVQRSSTCPLQISTNLLNFINNPSRWWASGVQRLKYLEEGGNFQRHNKNWVVSNERYPFPKRVHEYIPVLQRWLILAGCGL